MENIFHGVSLYNFVITRDRWETFIHASSCTDSFHYTRKRYSKVKEGILNFKEIASCKKSRKLLHTLQKANMRSFDAKHKSVYLSLTCGKQIIMEPVQRNMLSGGTPGFCKPIFRNRKCLLRESLTVLSKLMHIISKKLSLFLHLHMKIRRRRLYVEIPFTFWDRGTWYMWKVCLQTFRNNITG